MAAHQHTGNGHSLWDVRGPPHQFNADWKAF